MKPNRLTLKLLSVPWPRRSPALPDRAACARRPPSSTASAACPNRPEGSAACCCRAGDVRAPVEAGLDPIGKVARHHLRARASPTGLACMARISPSLMPPRIVASLKNSRGLNLPCPAPFARCVSTSAGVVAVLPPTGPMIFDRPGDSSAGWPARRARRSLPSLGAPPKLSGSLLVSFRKICAGVLRGIKPMRLVEVGIRDLGDESWLREQLLDWLDADLRTIDLRIEPRLARTSLPDPERQAPRGQLRIAVGSAALVERRVGDDGGAGGGAPPGIGRSRVVGVPDSLGDRRIDVGQLARRRAAACENVA